MSLSTSILAALYAASFSFIAAAPAPQVITATGNICDGVPPKYHVDSQKQVENPPVTGSKTCAGTSGCTLNDGSSYSVGVTIEEGESLSLNLGDITGQLETSVSYTTTTIEAQSASITCPKGPWKCAMIIWPAMIEASGTQDVAGDQGGACGTTSHDWKAKFPIKGSDGTTSSRVDVCACKNFEHWADNGAPSIVCPSDCA